MSDTGAHPRRSGGCQCGAVRFAVTGAPEEVSVCYCRMCQKAGGGPYLNLARFPAGAVEWTQGQPSFFRSSTIATRGFCATCGTGSSRPVTRTARRPDALSLTTGSFDQPVSLPPTTRFGIEGRLEWTDHLADLPSETADDWLDATPGLRDRLATYQHPDHDT